MDSGISGSGFPDENGRRLLSKASCEYLPVSARLTINQHDDSACVKKLSRGPVGPGLMAASVLDDHLFRLDVTTGDIEK